MYITCARHRAEVLDSNLVEMGSYKQKGFTSGSGGITTAVTDRIGDRKVIG